VARPLDGLTGGAEGDVGRVVIPPSVWGPPGDQDPWPAPRRRDRMLGATQWPDCGRHRQNASRIVWQGGFKGSADLSLASASTDLDPAIPGHRSDGPLRRVHPRHRLSFRRGSVITHRHAPPTLTKAVPDSFSTRS